MEAGQAVLERELQATKQKLSHEAGIIAKLKQQESMFRSSLKQGTTSALVMKGGLATGQQLDGEEAEGGEEARRGSAVWQRSRGWALTLARRHPSQGGGGQGCVAAAGFPAHRSTCRSSQPGWWS